MIDASFTLAPAREILAVDMWEGDPPHFPDRAIRVEPRRWWLLDGGEIDSVRAAIGERGAVAAIGGGLVRATITGPEWRDLLSVSGFLDTESLGVDDVVGTLIHHVPVHIFVTSSAGCEVYCAASYADTLAELWQGAAKGG